MHELALMETVAAMAAEAAFRHGAQAVTGIRLRVGSLAGVEADALHFAAAVVLAEGVSAGAWLQIEVVPARAWCAPCARLFAVEPGAWGCPRCGVAGGELRQGRELELAALELRIDAGDAAGVHGTGDAP